MRDEGFTNSDFEGQGGDVALRATIAATAARQRLFINARGAHFSER